MIKKTKNFIILDGMPTDKGDLLRGSVYQNLDYGGGPSLKEIRSEEKRLLEENKENSGYTKIAEEAAAEGYSEVAFLEDHPLHGKYVMYVNAAEQTAALSPTEEFAGTGDATNVTEFMSFEKIGDEVAVHELVERTIPQAISDRLTGEVDGLANAGQRAKIGTFAALGRAKVINSPDMGNTSEETNKAFDAKVQKALEVAKAADEEFRDSVRDIGEQCFLFENIKPFVMFARGGKGSGITLGDHSYSLEASPENPINYAGDDNYEAGEYTETIDITVKGFTDTSPGVRKNGYWHKKGHKLIKLISSKNPSKLLTDLTGIRDLEEFNKATPEMYAALIPQIDIFKILHDGTEIQFPFTTHIGSAHANPTEMLEKQKGRSDDVGLMSFEYEHEGAVLALATDAKAIKAKLKIIFNSASSLTKTFTVNAKGKKGEKIKANFKYEDLFAQGGSLVNKTGDDIKVIELYDIRVVVGYGAPSNMGKGIPKGQEFFKKAREKARISLSLNMLNYDLEFTETGQIITTIEYMGRMEQHTSSDNFDIFAGKMAGQRAKLRQLQLGQIANKKEYADIEKKDKKGATKKLKDLRKLINSLTEDHALALNEIYGPLRERILSRVFKMSLTRGDVQKYLYARSLPPLSPTFDFAAEGQDIRNKFNFWHSERNVRMKDIRPASWTMQERYKSPIEKEAAANATLGDVTGPLSDALGKIKAYSADELDQQNHTFYFIYFGDILASLLEDEEITRQMTEKKMTIVMAQAIFIDQLKGNNGIEQNTPVAVNIADIPISFSAFNSFFTKEIVNKKVESMTLHRFITLMMNSIVFAALGKHCRCAKGKWKTSQLVISFHTARGKPLGTKGRKQFLGDYTKKFFQQPVDRVPIFSKNREDYMFIHMHDGGFLTMNGDESVDRKGGLMHYRLASDRGLLKSCTLKKAEVSGQQEIWAAGAATETRNIEKLWNIYNADIKFFGNPNIKPYVLFFLDPTMPGIGSIKDKNSAARRMKIGGYYNPTKVSNTISAEGWETEVEAWHVALPKEDLSLSPKLEYWS